METDETLPENQLAATQLSKTRHGRAALAVKIVLWSVAVLIVVLSVVSYGIYRVHWQGAAVAVVEKILPFPAAMVNFRVVSIHDMNQRFEAYKRAIAFNQQYDFSDPANKDDVLKQQEALLNRMVDLKLEQQLADSYGTNITQAEIDNELTSISAQAQVKPENLDELISNIYGWDHQTFIDEVVVPQIRGRKLQQSVAADTTVNAQAHSRAEDVLQQLQAGGDFVKLAQLNSDDPGSKSQGGDLGWNPPGVFVPEFEEALSKLEPGATSDIVTTQFGYHIIQVLGRAGSGTEQKTHVRHILIVTKQFTEWFDEQKTKAKIWKFSVLQ